MILRSVRFRITVVAGLVVTLILVGAGTVLVALQRRALTDNLDHVLARRADDIGLLLEQGSVPSRLAAGPEEGFVQLVDAGGMVASSTANLAGEPPLQAAARDGTDTIRNIEVPAVDDDVFRVLTRPLRDGGVLHVATTYDVVSEGTGALVGSLAVTIPAVVAILAALVWWLVGRTLRPVESIRAEVATIGSTRLDRRVPRPGTRDEIDRLATTMNQMLERLESSVERQQRFVADSSHELRSPLTRLRAELELHLESSPPEEERQRLASLLDEVAGLERTVDDLLYLARSDGADRPVALEPLDLDDIVLAEARRFASDRRVEVGLSAVSAAHLRGDRGELRRAIKNLLDNAVRHAATSVEVGLTEWEGLAVLTVRDDGAGIPEGDAEKVFERFGRVDPARSADSGGTGLGLAIARHIAERHGGTLVLNNPGQPGAIFELRIPLA